MAQRTGFYLANTDKPVSGPCGVNVSLDFTGGDNISGDLALEQMQSIIDFVQSIWIDNSLNAKALTIVFGGTGQRITVKPNTQGMYPVIAAAGQLKWTAQSVGSGLVVPVIMMNVVQDYFQWATV